MRRLFAGLSLLTLVGLVGCHQRVGICDCEIPGHHCMYGCNWHHHMPAAYLAVPAPAAPTKGEPAPAPPAKELPRGEAN